MNGSAILWRRSPWNQVFRPLRILLWSCLALTPAVGGEDALERGPFLRLETGGHTSAINMLRFSHDGKEVYAAGRDKFISVWDVATGERKRTLRVPIGRGARGEIEGIDVSPDGRWVAAYVNEAHSEPNPYVEGETFWYDSLILLASESGRIVDVETLLLGGRARPEFSPNGRWLLVSGLLGRQDVFSVDEEGRLTNRASHARKFRFVGWIPGTQKFVAKWQREPQFCIFEDLETLPPTGKRRVKLDEKDPHAFSGGRQVTYMMGSGVIHPKRPLLVSSWTNNTVLLHESITGSWEGDWRFRVLNSAFSSAETMQRIMTGEIVGIESLRISPDGEWLAGRFGDQLLTWSLAGGQRFAFKPLDGSITDLRWSPVDPNLLAVAGGLENSIVLLKREGSGRGAPSAKSQWRPEAHLRLQGAGRPVFAVATAPGLVAWGNTPARADLFRGFSTWMPNQSGPLEGVFDVESAQPVHAPPSLGGFQGEVTRRGSYTLTDKGGTLYLGAEYVAGNMTCYTFYSDSRLVTAIWDIGSGYELETHDAAGKPGDVVQVILGHHDIVTSLAPYDGGRLIVSGSLDQTVRFSNPENGELLLSLWCDKSGEWIAWTPQGYYKSSPSGDRFIGWHLNNGSDREPELYPADRFRATLERPDIVEQVLETGSVAQAVERANKALRRRTDRPAPTVERIEDILPPVVEILAPSDGAIVQADKITVRLRIVPGPSKRPVTAVVVNVNGHSVVKSRGVKVSPTDPEAGAVVSQEIPLELGENVITAFSRNTAAESLPAIVRVKREQPTRPAEQELRKPTLYVLAIGVSAYKEETLRLRYGAADAERAVAALRAQKGKLFGAVEARLLVDGSATRAGILKGLNWLDRQTTQHDLAVLYVSGHGWRDETNDYFFLPADVDAEDISINGVLWSRFSKTVGNISARARVLFLLDTCHSGGVTGAEVKRRSLVDATALIKELSSVEVGAVVLAAASGRHVALESPEWGGGAFTTAFVEGLRGDADLKRDGVVRMKELDLYISDRVKTLTDGRQQAVSGWPTTLPDFPIARVP